MKKTPEQLAAHMEEHHRLWAEAEAARQTFLALGRETAEERTAKRWAGMAWDRAHWAACEHSSRPNPWKEEPPDPKKLPGNPWS